MADVNLKIDNMRAVLDNGLLHIEINERGSVDSLVKNNKELVSNLCGADGDVNKKRTFYLDYHVNGKFRDFTPSELKVIENSKDFVHIAYVDKTSLIKAEYHMIMKSDISGLYSYVIAGNNTDETLKVSELRTVYRMGRDNFYMAYNAERTGYQPTHIELEKYEKLQDETYRYENGEVYSKYDYAGYFKDNSLWGEYGDEFGAWFIPASKEYYPSGPLKQELLVHYDGIILNYMTGSHFGSGQFLAEPGWEKFYGPWLFYINSGKKDELPCDALKVAKAQESEWPYKWVNEEMYPLKRARVTGKIVTDNNTVVKNPMVVLAKEGGEFLRQKGDYIFYAKGDEEGNFSIDNVRYGDYTLYAYATSGLKAHQLEKDNVEIREEKVELNNVIWSAPEFNNLLWQIGTSSRTSSGFKYSNELRNYKWMTMIPKELNFTIGKDNEHEDWYYSQIKDSVWNVNFNLDKKFKGKGHLTVALAAATTYQIGISNKPVLIIRINGEVVKKAQYENDTTVYRSAVKSGRYHLEEIEFDASILKPDKNIISFESIDGAFMYDTILLETEDTGTIETNIQMLENYKTSNYISEKQFLNIKQRLEGPKDDNYIENTIMEIKNQKFESEFEERFIRNINNMKF